MIEEQARKQIKEQETRKQAQQLMGFLLFADVLDFEDNTKISNFKSADFEAESDFESYEDSDCSCNERFRCTS